MARRTIRCKAGERRFTVLRVNSDKADTHAARSYEAALRLAQPDRGARLDVFAVCAQDAGAARLKLHYGYSQLLRTMRYKRGG